MVLVVVSVLLAGAYLAPGARAADEVFYEGLLSNQSATSLFYEPLSQTSARSLDGNSVCVAALYLDGTQAGSVVCDNDLAVHPYCHCNQKYGYARSLIGGTVITRARMNWPS